MVFHCRLKQIIVWLTRCTWIRANWSLQKQFTWLLLRWEKPSWQAPYCTTVSQKRRNCLTTQTYGLCSNGRGSNLLWTSLIATPATALCTAYRKYCLVKKKSFLKSVLTWSQSCKTLCPFLSLMKTICEPRSRPAMTGDPIPERIIWCVWSLSLFST